MCWSALIWLLGFVFAVGISAVQESAVPNHSTATLCLDVVPMMWANVHDCAIYVPIYPDPKGRIPGTLYAPHHQVKIFLFEGWLVELKHGAAEFGLPCPGHLMGTGWAGRCSWTMSQMTFWADVS